MDYLISDKVIVESESIKGEYEISECDLSSSNDNDDNFTKAFKQKSCEIIFKSDNDILSNFSNSDNQTQTFSTCDNSTSDSIFSKSNRKTHSSDKVFNSNISKSSSIYHTCDEIHSLPNSTEDSSDHTNKLLDNESLSDEVSPLKFTVTEDNQLFSVLFKSNDNHNSKESLVFENEKFSCSPLPHKNYFSKTTLNKNKKDLNQEETCIPINNNDQLDKDIKFQFKFPDYLDVSESVPALSITSQLPILNDTRNIVEEYKYEDKQAGIVLVEKRLLSIASM